MTIYLTTDSDLTSVANAIRTKGGTTASLVYPTGYVNAINAISGGGGGSVTPNLQQKSITPSETQQTVSADSGYDGLSTVTVAAITATYVGSGIERKNSASLSVNGDTVSVPAGYYASNASKAVAAGNAGTPIATKGTVNNHTITITPSVTNTTGYIIGSTKIGTAISVSANELVSGTKTITTNGNNIDVINYASVNVNISGDAPSLQSKTITPTENSQSVTPDNGYDGLSDVTVMGITPTYVGSSVSRKSSTDMTSNGATVTAPAGYYAAAATKTISSGSVGNPTISVNSSGLITATATATAGYITSGTKSATLQLTTQAGTTIVPSTSQVVAVASGRYTTGTVTVAAITAGTAGTPIANKGGVSNHAVTITPTVTNTTGYIAGSTKNGTAITVSASELVSGTLSITSNGTQDVTNYATVSINVEGGGSSSDGLVVTTASKTLSSAASSIQFTGLSGQPTSFVITSSADQTTGGTKVVSVAYDGTYLYGMDITTQMANDSGFTQSYSNGTLTVTATSASFQANEYKLVYSYGGSAEETKEVQVGSGATSITFTGLTDEPQYFACIFTSTFSTSSGYQRVVEVVYDGDSTYGHAMDSSAKLQTSWSYTYNNGSLTISSTGTNNGGYFHQPGYYKLIYAVGTGDGLQSKTVTPTTTVQTITADEGYTALRQVTVQAIPSQYIIPTGTITISSNGTVDVTDYASANVSVSTGGGGATNFVTGTFTVGTTTATAATVSIPYTGSGYPIMTVVEVEGGAYNSSNTTWYNAVTRYAVGQFVITKGVHNDTPTYGTSGAANYGVVQVFYKNSTSNSTSYSSTRSATANSYTSSNANGTNTTCVRWKGNNKTLSYYVAGGGSSSYGLLSNTTYRYYVYYSS